MPDKLVILDGDRAGAEHALDGQAVLIGSDALCALRLADAAPRHASVERHDGVWTARALGAGQPLSADGRALESLRLDHGAIFAVGSTRLRFSAATATIEQTAGGTKRFSDVDMR